MNLFSMNESEEAIYLEYFGDKDGDRIPSPEEIGIHPLEGDGDFRSPECVELLKEADIVVLNSAKRILKKNSKPLIKNPLQGLAHVSNFT